MIEKVTLKDAMSLTTFDEVNLAMKTSIYEFSYRWADEDYEFHKVWKHLQEITPEKPKTNGYFIISEKRSRCVDETTLQIDSSDSFTYLDIVYWDSDNTCPMTMDFSQWKHWLAIPISTRSINTFGLDVCVGAILTEMTFYGTEEDTISTVKDEVERRCDEVSDKSNLMEDSDKISLFTELTDMISSMTEDYIEIMTSVSKEDFTYNLESETRMRMPEWEGADQN